LVAERPGLQQDALAGVHLGLQSVQLPVCLLLGRWGSAGRASVRGLERALDLLDRLQPGIHAILGIQADLGEYTVPGIQFLGVTRARVERLQGLARNAEGFAGRLQPVAAAVGRSHTG
jgi:hypothetical protein